MWRLIRRSVLANKTRFILTALSIVLGVGFVASTYIYTDTINAAFSSIFDDAFAGIDAQVSSESEFSFSDPPLLDESVADAVAAVPGVATAVPSLQRAGVQFIDDEGEPVSNGGAPNFGGYFSEDLGDSFLGLEIAEGGHAPTAPNEVLVDAGTADDLELSVGDSVDIISTTTAARPFDVVGIVQFAGLDNLGGATFALFDLPTIQGLVGAEGQIDGVIVLADPGVEIDTLVADIQATLPAGAIAESAQDAAEAEAADIQEGLAFFGTFLNTFGFIALFVGTFIIANTFRIVVAQRTRELALLRALGATARQVRRMVIGEALLVGVLASIVGILAGFGLAVVLQSALNAFGLTLPSTTLQLQARTVVVSLVVGVVVTLISAWLPARRASRVAPLAAIRETAASVGSMRTRGIAGVSIVGAGLVALFLGLFTSVDFGLPSILLVGLGAAVVLIGVTVLAPLVARPMVRVIGPVVRPLAFVARPIANILIAVSAPIWIPLFVMWQLAVRRVGVAGLRHQLGEVSGFFSWIWRWPTALARVATRKAAPGSLMSSLFRAWRADQVPGTLAEGNARRTPRRTSATAGAIMIGVALVALAAVMAASIRGTIDSIIDEGIQADLFVQPENTFQFTSFTPDVAARLEADADVAQITTLRQGGAILDGNELFIAAVEDDFTDFVAFDELIGSFPLSQSGIASDKGDAESNNWVLGSEIEFLFPDGQLETFAVEAIYEAPGAAGYAITKEAFAAHNPSIGDSQVYVKLAPGVDLLATQERLIELASDVPTIEILTLEELRSSAEDQINTLLNFITGLLGLAVVISLFGVTNTMTLSVFERTREIGLLRAVGMTRVQTRQMIRSEASIISAFGAILGVVVGIFFGWSVIRALADEGFNTFAVPFLDLVLWILAIGALGILFALLPAWRASRLNVLEAISYE